MQEHAFRFIARDAWKEGLDFFAAAVAREPDSAEAHAHLGFFCVKQSRYDTTRGLAELEQALSLDPRCALACVYQAIVLAAMRQGPEARLALGRAEELGAPLRDRVWAQAYIELNTGPVQEAVACFRRLAELWDGSTSLILLAQALSQAGDDEAALKAARSALAKDPRDYRGPLYAAISLVQMRRCDEARVELATARELDDSSPLLHHTLGFTALKEGRCDEAEGHLRAALSHDADYVTSRKLLGDICAASGREEEARRHYARALSLFPDYPEAREALERLER